MPITRRPGESLAAFNRRKARIKADQSGGRTAKQIAEQRADRKARETAVRTSKNISKTPKARPSQIKLLQTQIVEAQGANGADNNTSLDLKAKLRKLKKK